MDDGVSGTAREVKSRSGSPSMPGCCSDTLTILTLCHLLGDARHLQNDCYL
jgi:hypothetical protein